MDKANRVQTISSSLELPLLSGTSLTMDKPQQARVAMLLARLAAHYYRPDFSEAQAKSMISDMVFDLAEFTIAEVEVAINAYRQDAERRFFPTSGAIRGIIQDAKKAHATDHRYSPASGNYEFGESRPCMWWTMPKALWKDNWCESEIPAQWIDAYRKRAERAVQH